MELPEKMTSGTMTTAEYFIGLRKDTTGVWRWLSDNSTVDVSKKESGLGQRDSLAKMRVVITVRRCIEITAAKGGIIMWLCRRNNWSRTHK